jgi:hypothetical protein
VVCRCAGLIHGDLKAANVMLTQGGDDQEGVWAPTFGHRVRLELRCSTDALCTALCIACSPQLAQGMLSISCSPSASHVQRGLMQHFQNV